MTITDLKRYLAILKNKILKSEIEIGKSDGNAKTIIPEYKVTAVIPNYNYARYLQERLDSILFQTYPVAEVIILDDCSKDNSIEVIQRLIEENKSGVPIKFIPNEKNSGVYLHSGKKHLKWQLMIMYGLLKQMTVAMSISWKRLCRDFAIQML